MDLLRISLVQFDICWEEPAQNRLKLGSYLEPLKGKTDLILLPEMFTTGFSMKAHALAETMDGESVTWMKSQAHRTGSAIAGSLIIEDNGSYFNRFLFVSADGQIYCYDKRHLFSMGEENKYFTQGEKRIIVAYKGWRIALFTCYDLRFPVWCRSIKDADLMLFTANWPESREMVWQSLTQARAIENQLYVAGANRIGTDGAGISYSGASRVIDPRGRIIVDLNNCSAQIETCTISLSELNRFREKFPVSRDEDSFEIFC